MNILIFNWRDKRHEWAGGSEVYIDELASGWAKNNKVTLFCAQDRFSKLPYEEQINGVKVIRKGGRYSVYFWAFLHYLKSKKTVDIIVDVENGIPFFTPLYSRKKIICLVYHVHGRQFFYELAFPLSIIGYLLERFVFPLVYGNKLIIAISRTTKNELIKLGFDEKKISLVHPGVGKIKVSDYKKYKKPTILYLGRIKKYKRIDRLIEIFKEVAKENKKAQLIIAGWGSEAPFISDMVMRSSIRKQVKILGPVTEKEKAELYGKSWLFVNPSLHEGWGISVIEANMYSTPALAFKVPGLSDSIVNNKTGVLVDNEAEMAKKILELLNDTAKIRVLGKGAVKWSQKYTWKAGINKSLKILKSNYQSDRL